jgi:hypothetical protein
LVLQTDDSRNLETMIHAALRYAGKQIRSFRGTEWFRTNPREVESLFRVLNRTTRALQGSRS